MEVDPFSVFVTVMAMLVGTALLFATGAIVWQIKAKKLSSGGLCVGRKAGCEECSDPANDESMPAQMSMDREKAKAFNSEEPVGLTSLLAYFDSLEVPEEIAMEQVLISILAKFGLDRFLPGLMLVPARLRSKVVGKVAQGQGFLPKMLSPTVLAALSQSAHAISKKQDNLYFNEGSALQLAREGSDNQEPNIDEFFYNPFILSKRVPEMIETLGLSAATERGVTPMPSPVADNFLPGLCKGDAPGKKLAYSPKDIVLNRLMSRILNRLASNTYPKSLLDEDLKTQGDYIVRLSEDSEDIVEPEKLLLALSKEGHTLNAGIITHATSFGAALCMQDAEDPNFWRDIAVGFPLRTGIRHLNEQMEVEMSEITMMTPHSSFFVEVSGPLVAFRSEFFQGVGGYTGWNPPALAPRDWQNGKNTTAYHGEWNLDTIIKGVDYASHVMNVYNHIGSKWNLPMGGYGYTGVCLDSVALIQRALFGKTTVFPILVGGTVKVEIAQVFHSFHKHMIDDENPDFAAAVKVILDALFQMPCDIVIEPDELEWACERLLATIPEGSPYRIAISGREEAKHILNGIRADPTIIGLS